jgi:Flp pilus assembly protein TadG
MRAPVLWLRRLKRFGREDRAAAAVEFALILPFLLLLFTGSLEASSLITVDRRINVISGTVGDLVSRWDPDAGAIQSATLTDYFKASQGIIFPYSTTGLKQIVSVVEVSSTGVTKVKWSCGYNGGVKRATDSQYTSLPAKMNELARPPSGTGYVVASEVAYSYKPVLGIVFTNALNLYNESFYLPRYQSYITGPTC